MLISYFLWTGKPVLFSTEAFTLRWSAVFFILGFLLGRQILLYMYRKEGKPTKTVSTLCILLVLSAFIGARFFHLLLYEPHHLRAKALTIILPFETEPSFNLLDQSEFSVHGAVFGIFVLLLFHKGKNRLQQNYFQLLDRITPASAVAAIFLLMGSFASSKIIGRPTDSFAGTVFIQPVITGLSKVPCCIMRSPDGNNPLEKIIVKKDPARLKAKTSHRSVIFYLFFKPGLSEQLVNEFLVGDVKAYLYDMAKFVHEPGTEPLRYRIFLDTNGQYIARVTTLGISRHPVQLFDAFVLLIISALVFWRGFTNEGRAAAAGKDFGIFMMCFWSAHFMLQFLKEPERSWLGSDMNTVLVLDILFILTGAIVFFKSVRKDPAVHY